MVDFFLIRFLFPEIEYCIPIWIIFECTNLSNGKKTPAYHREEIVEFSLHTV